MPPKPPRLWVLVVDDEKTNCDTFRRVFRGEYHVIAATSASDALDKLEERTFDVAFVDHAMPGMNGVEFLKLAKDKQPAMGRVLLTAYGDLEVVQQAKADGLAATVIMKPWDKEDVVRWIDQLQKLAAMKRSLAELKATTH